MSKVTLAMVLRLAILVAGNAGARARTAPKALNFVC